jgi:hypothetical protein
VPERVSNIIIARSQYSHRTEPSLMCLLCLLLEPKAYYAKLTCEIITPLLPMQDPGDVA